MTANGRDRWKKEFRRSFLFSNQDSVYQSKINNQDSGFSNQDSERLLPDSQKNDKPFKISFKIRSDLNQNPIPVGNISKSRIPTRIQKTAIRGVRRLVVKIATAATLEDPP